ncbi:hypothetical protein [Escherichia coli]|uniref:hypothetical protein n=1 Tax=Escherichia coli TaxID=562 RepID=UPI001CEDEF2A|nr:hypothetical protein [Escherichia coli]
MPKTHSIYLMIGNIPGVDAEGKFDVNAFNNWFDFVQTECEKSGHLDFAYHRIGSILIFSPANDEHWILPELAEFLNRRELDKVRTGYKNAIINSRGVYIVDPEGKPELELAQQYHTKSDAMELLGFHRFARILRELAHEYQAEAELIIEQHSKKKIAEI